jgi:hypothetical protein
MEQGDSFDRFVFTSAASQAATVFNREAHLPHGALNSISYRTGAVELTINDPPGRGVRNASFFGYLDD